MNRGGLLRARSVAALLLLAGLAVPQSEAQAQETPEAARETPQASFDAAGAPPAPQAAAGPLLSFNFRFAPWDDVLAKFADVADLTLDLSEVPAGTFNYYDRNRYTPREALDVLNGYLLPRGYLLVRRDRFLVCVNIQKGVPPHLVPVTTMDRLGEYGKNELVSVIFPLRADTEAAAAELEQLVRPPGSVTVLRSSGALVVTDMAGNLRLFERLLGGTAVRGGGPATGDRQFRSFSLQHVAAAEAERMIREFLGIPPTGAAADDALRMTADPRANRLFVAASAEQLAEIQQMIDAVDVATESGGAGRPAGATARIVPLPRTDVIVIGRALESLTPRIKVTATRSERPPVSPTSSPAAVEKKPGPQPAPAAQNPPNRPGDAGRGQ